MNTKFWISRAQQHAFCFVMSMWEHMSSTGVTFFQPTGIVECHDSACTVHERRPHWAFWPYVVAVGDVVFLGFDNCCAFDILVWSADGTQMRP